MVKTYTRIHTTTVLAIQLTDENRPAVETFAGPIDDDIEIGSWIVSQTSGEYDVWSDEDFRATWKPSL